MTVVVTKENYAYSHNGREDATPCMCRRGGSAAAAMAPRATTLGPDSPGTVATIAVAAAEGWAPPSCVVVAPVCGGASPAATAAFFLQNLPPGPRTAWRLAPPRGRVPGAARRAVVYRTP